MVIHVKLTHTLLLSTRQQSTRHLYYLQLRKDVLEGGIYVHEETAMLLASYALQAEVGDYNQNVHGSDYFVPEHYLPQRVNYKKKCRLLFWSVS